jgi:glycosyltransferase involved in cell wall biosynthesis
MLRSYFRRENPSVVLCHFGYVALRLLDVAQESGVPMVAHFHGRDVASMLRFAAYRRSLLKNLRRFDEIVVVGTHQRQWMLEQGCRPERVHLIPCGVPTEQFVQGARTPSDTIRFAAVSRLADMKGPEYTLKAFALSKARIPRSSLVMVGDGPMRADLERAAVELGVADSVRFTGSVSPEEVRRELVACDVFLQHSVVVPGTGDCEGFGVSVAEAASAGLPVVSTLCPGIVDQVVDGATGFLVPQRDAEAMAARMVQLARDPELRASMGTAGRQRAVSCFDVEKQLRELEDVLIRAGTRARV